MTYELFEQKTDAIFSLIHDFVFVAKGEQYDTFVLEFISKLDDFMNILDTDTIFNKGIIDITKAYVECYNQYAEQYVNHLEKDCGYDVNKIETICNYMKDNYKNLLQNVNKLYAKILGIENPFNYNDSTLHTLSISEHLSIPITIPNEELTLTQKVETISNCIKLYEILNAPNLVRLCTIFKSELEKLPI